MTVNTSSFDCFKRETTPGTSLLVAVDSTTAYHGQTSDKDEKTKETELDLVANEILEYYTNAARNANLIYGQQKFNLRRRFHVPTSMLAYYMFLGYGADAVPATITMRNTGGKDAYSLRHEEAGGTNQLIQTVGSYCVNIYGKSEMNLAEICLQDFAFMDIEDNGDYSPLTTMPVHPESISTPYYGKPVVTWDYGGGGAIELSNAWKAEWRQGQVFENVGFQTPYQINLHEYTPVELIITGNLDTNTQWNALVDKTTHDIHVKTYKKDTTYYNNKKFTNCKLKSIKKLGKLPEGKYVAQLILTAEKMEVDFVHEFGANFTTWLVNAPP